MRDASIPAEHFPKSVADADKQRFVLETSFAEEASMRPNTLAQAAERVIAGELLEKALPEFLDTFYLAQDIASQIEMLRDEPLSIDARRDALMGAVAEYLAHEYALPKVPAWAFGPTRYLDHAWHAVPFDDDGMREYLTFASPSEFASRNIFTEERPLRRARGPLNRAGRAPS